MRRNNKKNAFAHAPKLIENNPKEFKRIFCILLIQRISRSFGRIAFEKYTLAIS